MSSLDAQPRCPAYNGTVMLQTRIWFIYFNIYIIINIYNYIIKIYKILLIKFWNVGRNSKSNAEIVKSNAGRNMIKWAKNIRHNRTMGTDMETEHKTYQSNKF